MSGKVRVGAKFYVPYKMFDSLLSAAGIKQKKKKKKV
jgi:hypothetical protein